MKQHKLGLFSRAAAILGVWSALALPGIATAEDAQDAGRQPPQRPAVRPVEHPAWSNLRLNELRLIGTHNSYKTAVQPELLDLMRETGYDPSGIDYSHLSLTDQLNLGVRSFELDVYHDPDGGRYADPLGERLLRARGVEPWSRPNARALERPGFKVLHEADFDFGTHEPGLEETLAEFRRWSDRNPGHLPIIITMNAKASVRDLPGASQPADFEVRTFDTLDEVISGALGDRLLTPDGVRGRERVLRDAVLQNGWPTVGESRGRFMFVLDHGGTYFERYRFERPSLRGRAMFATAPPTKNQYGSWEAEAAFMIVNDPERDADLIESLVREGFIVRTRADANTREARDEDHTRFRAALASGAHVISTDYAIPDRAVSDRFMIRFEDGALATTLEATVNINPDNAQGPEAAASRAAPVIVAHRGASADAPENTLAAWRLGLQRGARGVEGDFRLTADGRLIAMHDADTARTAGATLVVSDEPATRLRTLDVGSWKDARFASERPVLLDEALREVFAEAQRLGTAPPLFYIELKGGERLVGPMIEAIDSAGVPQDSLRVISFDAAAVAETKRLRPALKAFWLIGFDDGAGSWSPTAEQVVQRAKRAGADGVGTQARRGAIDQSFVKQLREAGLEWHAWTVNDEITARWLTELGVDSITTDVPGRLREQLRED